MGIPSIVIVSVGSALLAVAGFSLTRKLVKPIDLDEHQTFLDAMLSIVGTLVSILLGLLVAASMDRYQELVHQVDAEAAGVSDIFKLSHGLPVPMQRELQTLCTEYSYLVLHEEWPAMAEGRLSHNVFLTFGKLHAIIVRMKPRDDGEANLQAALLEAAKDISNGRRERALALQNTWVRNLLPVLLFCAVIVIAFTYLYVKRGAILHALIIGSVAIALGGNLGLIYFMSSPFKGDWKIQPSAFILNTQLLEEYLRSRSEKTGIPLTK